MAYEPLSLPPMPSDVRTRSGLERIRNKINDLVEHANATDLTVYGIYYGSPYYGDVRYDEVVWRRKS